MCETERERERDRERERERESARWMESERERVVGSKERNCHEIFILFSLLPDHLLIVTDLSHDNQQ